MFWVWKIFCSAYFPELRYKAKEFFKFLIKSRNASTVISVMKH